MKDGGPAFPNHPIPGAEWPIESAKDFAGMFKGMSLRDWFAGMAMAGIISAGDLMYSEIDLAGDAYRMADTMLAQREK